MLSGTFFSLLCSKRRGRQRCPWSNLGGQNMPWEFCPRRFILTCSGQKRRSSCRKKDENRAAGEGLQAVSRCSGHASLGWNIWCLPALRPELSYQVLRCNHKRKAPGAGSERRLGSRAVLSEITDELCPLVGLQLEKVPCRRRCPPQGHLPWDPGGA